MSRTKVFLAVSQLSHLWKRIYPVDCRAKGCSNPATYVLAQLFASSKPGRISGHTYHRSSAWCPEHVSTAVRRLKIPLVDTFDQALGICADLAVQDQRNIEESRRSLVENERRILAEHGRIQRMSGFSGRLFEKADGTWEIDLHTTGGTVTQPVCCAACGLWLIDNRHRERRNGYPERHSPGCPAVST